MLNTIRTLVPWENVKRTYTVGFAKFKKSDNILPFVHCLICGMLFRIMIKTQS